jgi:hypothetical protein
LVLFNTFQTPSYVKQHLRNFVGLRCRLTQPTRTTNSKLGIVFIFEVKLMLQLQIKSDSSDIEIVQNLVRSAIESEIKNLKRSLEKTNKLLMEFEAKYQVSSEFFFANWTTENLAGGDEEYITWAGEIKIKKKLTNSLQKLEAIEYVTQQLPS